MCNVDRNNFFFIFFYVLSRDFFLRRAIGINSTVAPSRRGD